MTLRSLQIGMGWFPECPGGLNRVFEHLVRELTAQGTLVTGLEKPDSLQVQVTGDNATVTIPGGHHVRLKRDGGVWRVDDFD